MDFVAKVIFFYSLCLLRDSLYNKKRKNVLELNHAILRMPVIASVAKQSTLLVYSGLLRRTSSQ